MTAALYPCQITHARAHPIPWVTAQVSALIRWQGIRLAARRLPIFPRPAHHAQEDARDNRNRSLVPAAGRA